MSEFGCFYNPKPSPGRCIKDPRSNVVEDKCEIANDRCRLKSDQPSQILVPTRETAKTEGTKVSIGDFIKADVTNSTLSGPVSAYSGNLNGQKLLLFGDVHFSSKNMCEDPCRKVEVNGDQIKDLDPKTPTNCWELDRLLSDIFTGSSKKNKWVDFYLEIPFLPKGEYIPTQQDIKSTIEFAGGLYNIFQVFYSCFNKYKCQFNTTRFHYSDVRLEYREARRDKILELMSEIPLFDIETTTLQGYVMSRIEGSINILINMIRQDYRKPHPDIESTDKIIKGIYFSGGMTMAGRVEPLGDKLFKIYLDSDDYGGDSQKLIQPLLDNLGDPTAVVELMMSVLMPKITVNRRGKNMHRTRAQLEGLEYEGKEELSNKIKSYLLEKYRENVDNSALVGIWSKFMKMYQNFINPKTGTLGIDMGAMMELQREYKNFTKLLSLNVSSTSLLMDGYIIARMFRSFPGTDHADSDVKIVYAGAAHIETYLDFFTKVMGISFYSYGPRLSEIKSRRDPNRCIDVNINRFV